MVTLDNNSILAQASLNHHMLRHREENADFEQLQAATRCDVCDRPFKSQGALSAHQREHEDFVAQDVVKSDRATTVEVEIVKIEAASEVNVMDSK